MKEIRVSREAREFLKWCLPALVIGLALRTWLMCDLPHALYVADSRDYLSTVRDYLQDGEIKVHSKKTFLAPFLFAVPFLLKLPALVTIAAFQHFLGLIGIALSGLLCRLWFRHWKVFIIPVTLLVAVNPSLLWFEHVIMGEAIFGFCVMLMLVCATMFALRPNWTGFAILCLGVFLAAGARPEGKLFFGFGLLLVAVGFWGRWKEWAAAMALFLALAAITTKLTSTSQPGLLIYTSLVHWTPDQPKAAPGISPYVAPVQIRVGLEWEERHAFATSDDRKELSKAVSRYLKDRKKPAGTTETNALAKKLGLETLLRNWPFIPYFSFVKFRASAAIPPGEAFDEHWLRQEQMAAYGDDPRTTEVLARGLIGEARTAREMVAFAEKEFDPARVAWFEGLREGYQRFSTRLTTPGTRYKLITEPGIPYLQLLAMAGLLGAVARADKLWSFHALWALSLIGFASIVIVTAPPKARFMYAFEPLWTLYALFLIDTLTIVIKRKPREPAASTS